MRGDADVDSLERLKGVRFGPGIEGSATESTTEAVFEALGLSADCARGSTTDPRPFAAAVEASASTGGQHAPPIMGAAAFVRAETLDPPYLTVMLAAMVPAAFFYLSVFATVHFVARGARPPGVRGLGRAHHSVGLQRRLHGPAAAFEPLLARRLGLAGLRIAAVTGDDVLDAVVNGNFRLDRTSEPATALGERLISTNAYTGIGGLAPALAEGADVVIAGRAADPALFLTSQVRAFGWAADDWTGRDATRSSGTR